MRDLVHGALFITCVMALALLAHCSTVHAFTPPKLDRSGTYNVIRYTYDNISDDIVGRETVSVGTFEECDAYVQRQGPRVEDGKTHIIFGCEKAEETPRAPAL